MPRVDERVVGREVRAAGKAEYDVDALRLQALHDGIDRSHALRPPSRVSDSDSDEPPGAARGAVYRCVSAVGAAPAGSGGSSLVRELELGRRSACRARRGACTTCRSPGTRGAARRARAVEHRREPARRTGTTAEIRNQRRNELPLSRPTTPPARPKKSAMTSRRAAVEHVRLTSVRPAQITATSASDDRRRARRCRRRGR